MQPAAPRGDRGDNIDSDVLRTGPDYSCLNRTFFRLREGCLWGKVLVMDEIHSYSSSTQQITVSDEEGSLQWTEKDGLRFLRATDLQGKVVFEGPISSKEDLKKLSLRVGERLQAMQESGQIPRD